jgi:hypothetical protein
MPKEWEQILVKDPKTKQINKKIMIKINVIIFFCAFFLPLIKLREHNPFDREYHKREASVLCHFPHQL